MPLPPIEKPHLLLVEGEDDARFVEALLERMYISDVQVRPCGGIRKKFRDHLGALLNDAGFGKHVRAYGIIRDADNDKRAAFQSVTDALREAGEPVPASVGAFTPSVRRIGIYLFPWADQNGCLEDLCLATVEEHPVMACVRGYRDCLRKTCLSKPRSASDDPRLSYYFPAHESKAMTGAFLAGMYRLHKGVGSAAKAGCWNFDHPKLDPLKHFISSLREITSP